MKVIEALHGPLLQQFHNKLYRSHIATWSDFRKTLQPLHAECVFGVRYVQEIVAEVHTRTILERHVSGRRNSCPILISILSAEEIFKSEMLPINAANWRHLIYEN